MVLWAVVACLFTSLAYSADTELKNDALVVRVGSDGSYTISAKRAASPLVRASAAAEVDHHWIKSAEYPKHEVEVSDFEDTLGRGRQVKVTATGLSDRPDLVYTIRVYDTRPFGEIQVQIQNHSARTFEVQSIRTLESEGKTILDLHANPAADRVLSDSFSEDWPPLQIFDLGKAPGGVHRAVGSQLVYNQQSKESVFFGALTADRLLTIFHLQTQPTPAGPRIAGFTVDSTGTTEIQATDEESEMRGGPKENLIELSLPLAGGESISAERLLFMAGPDYHAQLESYGAVIRELHHARIPEDNMLGWWSWTALGMQVTEGSTGTNALWQAEQLKSLGYDWFHFDNGYYFSLVDYAVPNASKFPHGMRSVTQRIQQLGLKFAIWTAPFEVGELSSVYEDHKDWLVHNAKGEPIQVSLDEEVPPKPVFVLDTTHPGAQEFLRQTYRTLVREWGAKYIKLDFMDKTAIEGYYYRPHTTALEALKIGLQVIRDAVGDDCLLDKDGSPMLNPVGIVDDGRVSRDTGHSFARSKEAAPGITARYYMHRNFFVNDPDAFTVSRQLIRLLNGEIRAPLTLNEAQVSIALAAVSGGMYEIGDDLPTLGADADRVALLKNSDLMQMVKLGRAAIPLDLLTYRPEDEQPSVFLLREDARQAVLAVFNWTEQTRSHGFSLSDLNLASGHPYDVEDVLDPTRHLSADGGSIQLEQPAHSVRVVRIVDASVPAAAPKVVAEIPEHAKVYEVLKLSCTVDPAGVPALGYHWDFDDGTHEDGRQVSHAYTKAGEFSVRLVVDGVDGIPTEKQASVSVNGEITIEPPSRYNPH
ncbi:MAG: PKD domain-containing protein [Candidatus Sulfotelmatobacter sp.]